MATLRWKHLRTPAWASVVGRHWPQSLVGKTVPMRAARPPRKGRRSTSSTVWPICASSAAAWVPETPPPMTSTESTLRSRTSLSAVRAGEPHRRLDDARRLVGDRRRRCRRAPRSSPRGCRRPPSPARARSRRWKRRAAKSCEQPAKTSGARRPVSMSSSRRAWPSRLHQTRRALARRRRPATACSSRSKSTFAPSSRRTRKAGRAAGTPLGAARHATLTGRVRRSCDLARDTGRASTAPVGQARAQAPQPRHFAASKTIVRKAADPVGHLDRARGLVARDPPQSGAERAAAAVRRAPRRAGSDRRAHSSRSRRSGRPWRSARSRCRAPRGGRSRSRSRRWCSRGAAPGSRSRIASPRAVSGISSPLSAAAGRRSSRASRAPRRRTWASRRRSS